MYLAHATEIPLPMARVERDDFADEPSEDRRPRAPYHRPSQREMVRASLAADELHTHCYDRREP